uniref:MMS19 nucleotide excision repair protein n=1 Tax=Panagrolaimus sp. PS1159 TaxID=55785 RepID=A0AC35GL96_9BILA
MGFAILKDEDNEVIAKYAADIKEKKKSILEFIETLKDDFSNIDTQEYGLTKLVYVLQKLPNDCLDETEVGSLLEFFLTRLEGSALRSGCVVTGIHHLILHSKNLPSGCEVPIFQSIYSESTVQCFSQPDRTELFEILDFFLKYRRQGLKSLGSEFILCFMRAVNGERDPRCLLQVFKLYLDVVKDFDLGVYCEDFFELLAVYYPLEYTPADTFKISREMLSSGLDSCLLSHKSFSFYCYQLISSKFFEEDTEEEMKVEICGFLAKAAKVFPSAPMKPFLEDFLTIFRRLCLNPSNKSSNEIPMDIENAILNILKAFENDKETVKSIANTMTENCEPFILQAEMGLTGKALSVLSVVSKGSKIAAEIILPQIMFWLGNLINADTVNAPQNRQEIIVEAINFLPDWLLLSIECECTQVVRDALPGFIESLKRTEEQFGSVVFPVEYKLSEILLSQSSKFEGDKLPTKELFEKIVWRSVTDLKKPDEKLRAAIQKFIIAFSKSDFTTFSSLVEKEIATRQMDSSLLELVALGICDKQSVEKFGSVIVEALKRDIDFDLSRCVIETIERNKDNNTVIEKLTDDLISAFIQGLENNEEISTEDAKIKAKLLQQIVLKLNQSKVEELSNSFVTKWKKTEGINREKLIKVTALSILQSKNTDILEKALNLTKSQSNLEEISNYLAFALSIYKQDSAEPLSWISIKSSLLLNRPNALQNLENFFQNFISSSDVSTTCHLCDIFDFDSAGFNPSLNRYPVSILWRQRILCQFIPVYVKYFSQISSTNSFHRSAFFELLNPILANAQKLTVPLSTELLQILPILTEALELLS